MTPLRIQSYLRSAPPGFQPLVELERAHNVKARRHAAYPNLVLLKYGIDADFTNPMVRECRGLILDESNDWAVVSRAFDKFGNHGESYAAPIDWSTARVQEKLDGSLCVLYHYDGSWHVATSGSPDASGEVQRAGEHEAIRERHGKTFALYFWETFHAQGGVLPVRGHLDDLCFAFELMGPMNRVVVVHEEPHLRLIGVRDVKGGAELNPGAFSRGLNVPVVRSFPLGSMAEIEASFAAISPLSQEGYVVVDAAFNRVKVKHPQYVAIHHAKDGLGPRAFVEIARSGEVPEVVAAFPELAPLLERARADFARLVARTEADYERLRGIESQRDFAAEAVKSPHAAALFKMRKGVGAADFYRSVPVDRLIDWMGPSEPARGDTAAALDKVLGARAALERAERDADAMHARHRAEQRDAYGAVFRARENVETAEKVLAAARGGAP